MKKSKLAVALLLIVTVVMSFTGCKKALSQEAFVSGCESYGLKKVDDAGILTENLNGRGGENGYYATNDKDEAKKLSNLVLNRFEIMPEIEASGFAFAVVREKGSDDKYYSTFACYMTFDDNQKAKDTYNNLVDTYGDVEYGTTGEKAGVTYYIESDVSAAGTNNIGDGIYLQGNNVIYLRSLASVNDSYKFADKICGKLGLISLSKAE